MAADVLHPSQYSYQVIKTFSAGDEIKQLLRSQRAPVARRIVDYHSSAFRHIKVRGFRLKITTYLLQFFPAYVG